jgi:NADH-quinone oxidoreductase subunit N
MTNFAYAPILPEIVLIVSALLLLMLGVFRRNDAGGAVSALAILALCAAMFLIAHLKPGAATLFNGAFVDDAFARFMKILTLAGSAASILLSLDFLRRENILKFEYPVLILIASVGMMLMISAGDLIAVYLGLEMQSLALYVLAAFHRDHVRSSEAGLKYFVLGILSSGLLLYGMSLVYGYTGTTQFAGIAAAGQSGTAPVGFIFGLVFILAGLAFKIAAVPFHMWIPDVYEGAPTPVTAFFAAAPKVAAMALFVRVVAGAFPHIAPEWQQVVIALSVASMALGAFAAIGQRNIKRLMAYSAIGHVGYALIGLAAATPLGVSSVLIYLAIYMAMTLGSFACILAMRRSGGMVEDISELAGVSREQPLYAFLFAMLLFSLAGIPPLAGFFAKFYVFQAAIEVKMYWLAVTGVVLSVISAYYYLRIVKVMYFDEPLKGFASMPAPVRLVLGLSSAFVLLFFLSPGTLKAAADAAAASLF